MAKEKRKLLVIGERSWAPGPAFSGPSGLRLAKLFGLHSVPELLRDVGTTNLLPPGQGWDRAAAIEAAKKLVEETRNTSLVLCGARVAEAFGFRERGAVEYPRYVWMILGTNRIALVPHPSGRAGLWTTSEKGKARAFLRRALKEAAHG